MEDYNTFLYMEITVGACRMCFSTLSSHTTLSIDNQAAQYYRSILITIPVHHRKHYNFCKFVFTN